MPLNDDEPQSRGRIYHNTPGCSVLHPQLRDKVGFRQGNRWILHEVYKINRAPEPGCMSGGLYTLKTLQLKGENIVTATRENIQFPPRGQEGENEWDVID